MIEIEGLCKSYGATRVLDEVALCVEPGEILLLLGANGAGKSTLFRCILGIESYHGRVRVDGFDPLVEGTLVRRRIGYMPQTDGLHTDLTVAETVRFHGSLRGEVWERGKQLLHETRLYEARDLRVDEISGGMRQRLAFVLAQLSDPPILLLDEPTSSLDSWSRQYLAGRIEQLAGAGKTILVSTHAEHTMLAARGRPVLLADGQITSVAGWGGLGAGARTLTLAAVDTTPAGAR